MGNIVNDKKETFKELEQEIYLIACNTLPLMVLNKIHIVISFKARLR